MCPRSCLMCRHDDVTLVPSSSSSRHPSSRPTLYRLCAPQAHCLPVGSGSARHGPGHTREMKRLLILGRGQWEGRRGAQKRAQCPTILFLFLTACPGQLTVNWPGKAAQAVTVTVNWGGKRDSGRGLRLGGVHGPGGTRRPGA